MPGIWSAMAENRPVRRSTPMRIDLGNTAGLVWAHQCHKPAVGRGKLNRLTKTEKIRAASPARGLINRPDGKG